MCKEQVKPHGRSRKAVSEAVEKADKEASIRSVIETCQDLEVSLADIITRIALNLIFHKRNPK